RFELTFAALAPDLQVIAPWREWDFQGRADLIKYAEEKQIPISVSAEKPYSTDRNLLHISFESGILENPWTEPEEAMYVLTQGPRMAPDEMETIELEFEKGDCVAINGEKLSPANVLRKLNALGGKHGIGRDDIVENRFVGMKSRGVYETPGGTILYKAHRQLETLTMDREVMQIRDEFMPKYAQLIYNGFWFAPERLFLQAAIDKSQEKVSGSVKLKLYKGNIITIGRKSPYSLYEEDVASMEDDQGAYNQNDASGFIRLNALRLKNWGKQNLT
ncbi:MAG: argininosuccinate synthase, partial [Verrucomicrobiota bacterium]